MVASVLIAAAVFAPAQERASPLRPASELKAAFNAASDHVRLLIMLAPS